jgi:hypothetical protein
MSSFRVSFYIFQSIIQPLTNNNTNNNNHDVSGPRATATPLRDCSCTPGTVHRFGKLEHILGPPLRAGRYLPTVKYFASLLFLYERHSGGNGVFYRILRVAVCQGTRCAIYSTSRNFKSTIWQAERRAAKALRDMPSPFNVG